MRRSLLLNSTKSSNICPKSAAFPWEYSMVHAGLWYLTCTATISLPRRVLSFSTSTLSFLATSGIANREEDDFSSDESAVAVAAATTVYDGGWGGKKANLAAIEDVTPPMAAMIHKGRAWRRRWRRVETVAKKMESFIMYYLLYYELWVRKWVPLLFWISKLFQLLRERERKREERECWVLFVYCFIHAMETNLDNNK